MISKGREYCAILQQDLEDSAAQKIKKFNDLIDSTKKYWEPNEKADEPEAKSDKPNG